MSVHKQRNILITSEILEDHVNVLVAGELNTDSASRLEREIRNLVGKNNTRFVINIENLTLITSAGLRVLLVLAKYLQGIDGGIALYGPQANVREIFEVTGFDSILDLCQTYENATLAIGSSGMGSEHDQPDQYARLH